MKFVKMHGLGNDYVYVSLFDQTVADPSSLARRISDRHRGVGADGLILIGPSETADVRMEMYNADGSRGRMCGNGIRCVAKFAVERGLIKRAPRPDIPKRFSQRNPVRDFLRDRLVYLTVETDAGVKELVAILDAGGRVESVCVDMGQPTLKPDEMPVSLPGDAVIDRPFDLRGRVLPMTCVSMGNPHAVFFVEDLDRINLAEDGRFVETHELFPDRTNVHFVQVSSPREVTIKTWERGSGATQACGSGACAVCVAGVLTGRTERSIVAHLPGGDLLIEWAEDGHVYMTGPAEEVFTGCWPEP